MTTTSHTQRIEAIAAVGGGRVVSASADHTLKLWRSSNHGLLGTFSGHTAAVLCVVWLGDSHIVSGGADNTVRLWDVEMQRCLAVLEGHTRGVNCAAALAGHDRFVTGSLDGTLRLWSASSRSCLGVFHGHGSGCQVSDVVFVGANRIASCSTDKMLRVWDVTTQECMLVMNRNGDDHHDGSVPEACCLVHVSSDVLAVGCSDGQCELWSLSSGARTKTWSSGSSAILAAARLSPDIMVMSAGYNAVRVYDVGTQELVYECHTSNKQEICSLAVLPGNRVVTAARVPTQDGFLEVLQLPETFLPVLTAAAGAAAPVPAAEDGVPRLGVFTGHASAVNAVVHVGEDRVVSASLDRTLKLWRVSDQSLLGTLKSHTAGALCVIWLGDNRIVSGHGDNKVRVWNIDTQECLAVLEGHTEIVECAVAVGGGRFVTGARDATLRLWSVDSTSCLGVFHGHTGGCQIADVAFLGDDRIVSCSLDRTLRVWSLKTQECTQVIKRDLGDWYDESVTGPTCLVHVDADRLFVGCCDGRGELWNTSSGARIKTWAAASWCVRAAVLLAPATLLVADNHSLTVRNVDTDQTLYFCSTSNKEDLWDCTVLPGNRVVTSAFDGFLELLQLPESFASEPVVAAAGAAAAGAAAAGAAAGAAPAPHMVNGKPV